MFAESCSYLHYSFNRGEQTAINEDKAIEQNMSELKPLRIEVDRLGKHLLGMIKDLKEEIDVDRVRGVDSRVPPAHSTSLPVVDSR